MIKLEKVIIHAYKCIGEGESLEVANDMTVLMGKNEAGKTSVLEAMAKANYYDGQDEKFCYSEVYDYPRRKKREAGQTDKAPAAVTCKYVAEAGLMQKIEREMLLAVKGNSFSRTTDYKGKSRVTENSFTYSTESFLSAYAEKKEPLVGKFIHPLLNVRNGNELQNFINLREAELTREELKALKELAPYFENKHGWDNPINEYVYRTYLMPAIPKFLYYDEYRMLPSRVSVNELAEGKELTDSQRMAKALFFLAGIDVKKLTQESGFERYKSELELIQAEFTEEFLKFWKSDRGLAIEFELIREERGRKPKEETKGLFSWLRGRRNGGEQEVFLEIRVLDRKNMVSVPLGNRSRGFCWFFSFWVWFKAIQKENASPLVLLLDEPGLNLHASAQKDFMYLMKDIAKQNQIIFTTHSPYMLEEAEGNVFCIVSREGGSTIRRLEDETDEETLMPIRMSNRFPRTI